MTVTTDRAGAYTIEETLVKQISDDELRPYADLLVLSQREAQPGEPPMPAEIHMKRIRNSPKEVIRRDWIARDGGGAVVARATLFRYDSPENPHFREVPIYVLPEHRGTGLGRALFARVVAGAGESDEIVLTSWSVTTMPAGEAFAKRIGAKATLTNRISDAEIASIDPAMLREWAAIDPKGYRLVWIDGDIPDELMPQAIHSFDLMNTAPREQMQMNDWKATPEIVRGWEKMRKASGAEHRLLLALSDGGEAAGFTQVSYHRAVPHVVGQQGTAVDPAHRGHGIGKWIKAQMIERVRRDWPEAKLIRTGNAYSNAPMLSINDRLGFKVTFSSTVWQIALPDARRYVGVRAL